jgi:hypothetical protein
MKKSLLFLLALLALPVVHAQRTRDVVFLHNGSIIRGTIIMQNDSLLKIQSCCENVFAFHPSEVKEISTEKVVDQGIALVRRGYMNITTLGVLIGSTDNAKSAPFSAMMEHNYRFNRHFSLGGFHGFEQLNENLLPFGINMKVLWPAGRSDFFIAVNGGYSLPLEKPAEEYMKKATGGIMAGAETGLIIPVSGSLALVLSMGYRHSELNYRLEDQWIGNTDRHITYNRFSIRFGIAAW